jgi:hypothetical protein
VAHRAHGRELAAKEGIVCQTDEERRARAEDYKRFDVAVLQDLHRGCGGREARFAQSVSEHDSGKYLHVREDEPHEAAGDDHERLDLIPLQVVDLDVAKGAAHANLIRGSTIGAECEGKT